MNLDFPNQKRFKMGGGGSSTPAGPIAAPAAPASTSALEVTQAKIDAARQAKNKKGINSTILQGQQALGSGDDSSKPANTAGGTLLGGG